MTENQVIVEDGKRFPNPAAKIDPKIHAEHYLAAQKVVKKVGLSAVAAASLALAASVLYAFIH